MLQRIQEIDWGGELIFTVLHAHVKLAQYPQWCILTEFLIVQLKLTRYAKIQKKILHTDIMSWYQTKLLRNQNQRVLKLKETKRELFTWLRTLICRCINTPVKKQYINTLFEMAVYHKKREATIINFLSFISIDIKGFPFNFGGKIFTGFEMSDLESYTSWFFHYFAT